MDDHDTLDYKALLIRVLEMYAETLRRGPIVVADTRVVFVDALGVARFVL